MSDIAELPQMVTELVDLSKEYLRQETVDPAKDLGRSLGLGIAAAVCFGIGTLLLAVALTRWVADVLPGGAYWSILPYLAGITLMVLVIAVAAKRAQQ